MKMRVLLVDDEKDFVEALAQRLEIRDFTVATALSGDEALKRLGEGDFDVVILDVLMPGKGGVEVLEEMKKVKPLTQVIMLTGNSTVETAIEGMKVGAYDYLMKPTETAVLADKITKAGRLKAEHEERIRQAEIATIIKTRGW